jgi:hypothetical protein
MESGTPSCGPVSWSPVHRSMCLSAEVLNTVPLASQLESGIKLFGTVSRPEHCSTVSRSPVHCSMSLSAAAWTTVQFTCKLESGNYIVPCMGLSAGIRYNVPWACKLEFGTAFHGIMSWSSVHLSLGLSARVRNNGPACELESGTYMIP